MPENRATQYWIIHLASDAKIEFPVNLLHMVKSGNYAPSPRFVAARAGEGIDLTKATALCFMYHSPAEVTLVHIFQVFFNVQRYLNDGSLSLSSRRGGEEQ